VSTAPLHTEIAALPEGGEARYVTARDGTRLRIAIWPGERGTVLVMPGRTEYIEKCDRVIARLVALGFAVACIDWRGQGLSDRKVDDNLGYVRRYSEYQQDVAALLEAVQGFPRPLHIIAHSMGGAIGLRALADGALHDADVEKAVFSAPLWGLNLPADKRIAGPFLSRFLEALGRGKKMALGGRSGEFLVNSTAETNKLTSDPDRFAWMQSHLRSHKHLTLGPPTVSWAAATFDEINALMDVAMPSTETLVFLGTDERIVSEGAIMTQVERLPNSTLVKVPGARHEIFQERLECLDPAWDRIVAFLTT
jgi:lysophospholipase